MTHNNISIAILGNHYEVAMFNGNEIVGDIEWAFTPDQVAAAVKKLLSEPAPTFEVTPADEAAYEALQEEREEIVPFSELTCDQPSFPHDAAYAGSVLKWVSNPLVDGYEAVYDYAYKYGTSLDLALAAVNYIYREEK